MAKGDKFSIMKSKKKMKKILLLVNNLYLTGQKHLIMKRLNLLKENGGNNMKRFREYGKILSFLACSNMES